MKVNDFVKTIGYTRDRLTHFNFWIYDYKHYTYYKIDKPTVDDYIFLCDRDVVEWMFEDDDDCMSITVDAIPTDKDMFSEKAMMM